jgi:hypothetical protein
MPEFGFEGAGDRQQHHRRRAIGVAVTNFNQAAASRWCRAT